MPYLNVEYGRDSGIASQFSRIFIEKEIKGDKGYKYQLISPMKPGSNGTVFKCKLASHREAAVKFLHKLDDIRKRRFEFEKTTLLNLHHDLVLRIQDYGSIYEKSIQETIPFIVTDLFQEPVSKPDFR